MNWSSTLLSFKSAQLILLSTLLILGVSGDDWVQENGADPCKENGQCHSMMHGYETLIEGEGCRSFFSTGKCPRVCAYSMKSLITRRTWNRCAHRCEWSAAVTDAAASWLEMCLSRPADEPQVEDESKDINSDNKMNNGSTDANVDEETTTEKEHGLLYRVFHHSSKVHQILNSQKHSTSILLRILRLFYWIQIASIATLLISFIGVLAVSFKSNTPISVVAKLFTKRLQQWSKKAVRQIRHVSSRSIPKLSFSRSHSLPTSISRSSSKSSKQAAPDRHELNSLQRGARRHLKAMRANLD